MERFWSWVPDPAGMQERVNHARSLVGAQLQHVRYFTLDYARDRRAPAAKGPRLILDPREWSEPSWRFPDCDSVDFGVELETADGRVFSSTWDPPGVHEGLGLRAGHLIGSALNEKADAAIWDVTTRSGWAPLVGQSFTDVRLHYLPWATPPGFWCRRISLKVGPSLVELLLGEGRVNNSVGPSADNVAVLFDPPGLPDWTLHL